MVNVDTHLHRTTAPKKVDMKWFDWFYAIGQIFILLTWLWLMWLIASVLKHVGH